MTVPALAPPLDDPTGDGLTEEIADRLVIAIEELKLPRKYAATYSGVSPKTFKLWLELGAGGGGSALHIELARRVYQAEALAVGRQMGNLAAIGAEDARAAETFLRFFKPGDFGGAPPGPDEFDSPSRNAAQQNRLLESPPPRLLAKLRAHGYWRFPTELDPEDARTLVAIQDKYRARAAALLAGGSAGGTGAP